MLNGLNGLLLYDNKTNRHKLRRLCKVTDDRILLRLPHGDLRQGTILFQDGTAIRTLLAVHQLVLQHKRVQVGHLQRHHQLNHVHTVSGPKERVPHGPEAYNRM